MTDLWLNDVGLEERITVADVVFIHGLGGNGTTTWQASDASTFWPSWLFEDVPEIKVWSLEYPATKFAWNAQESDMSLPDRGKAILDLLIAKGIGSRPVVFVTHSLGGLLVKQILRLGAEFNIEKWSELVANTRGVVFLATPHNGSGLSTLISAIPLIHASALTTDLNSNDPHLRELNEWFQQNAQGLGLNARVYFEKIPLGPALVVEEGSANPGIAGCVPIPCDCNHLTICKPTTRASPVYLGVKSFVELNLRSEEETAGIAKSELSTEAQIAWEEEYEFFTKRVDEDEKLDLAEKLKRGDRASDIRRATLLKEQFAKRFTRNSLQSAATRRYVKVLAEVESRFNSHVFPQIADGASKAEVADLIREKVTVPILAAQANDELINPVVIDRMIYYLTGLCHIRWSP